MSKKHLSVIALVLLTVLAFKAYYLLGNPFKRFANIPEVKNIPSQISQDKNQTQQVQSKDFPRLSIVAKNLEIPWSLTFLPQGEIIFTERPGRVRIIDKEGNLKEEPVATINGVRHVGEGGLLGITVDVDFDKNHYVYVYYTYEENAGDTKNRVERYTYSNQTLKEPRIIVDSIPGNVNHNGGRIKFGPDNLLYITTGDAQNPSLSQNTNSTAGKILRVTADGRAASGNPFGNQIYSYGHRNPQGITWDNQGNLWETEHGNNATDELNLIEIGKNYGWPDVRGDAVAPQIVSPIIQSGNDTWAPSGTAYLNGEIYFAGLRGNSLFKYDIQNKKLTRYLKGELGRIRDVTVGPDNMLYITTSNRDGRGIATTDDDRIVRINPGKL